MKDPMANEWFSGVFMSGLRLTVWILGGVVHQKVRFGVFVK